MPLQTLQLEKLTSTMIFEIPSHVNGVANVIVLNPVDPLGVYVVDGYTFVNPLATSVLVIAFKLV